MPKSSLKRQQFNQKKPYLMAAVFCLILVVFAYGWFYGQVADRKKAALEELNRKIAPLRDSEQKLNKKLLPEMKGFEAELAQFTGWVEDRYYWANVLSQLRQILLDVEDTQATALKAKTGIWIEKLVPVIAQACPVFAGGTFNQCVVAGSGGGGASPVATPTLRGSKASRAAAAAAAGTNEITGMILTCRSVNMNNVGPAANTGVAYALYSQINAVTNYFDAAGTVLGQVVPAPDDVTITFEITVKLKRPFKL